MSNSRGRSVALSLALLTLVAGCTAADRESPHQVFFRENAAALATGFRLPDESEYANGAIRGDVWTSGEYNGDSTTDYAYILVSEATGARTLFAFVSTTAGYSAKQLDADFAWGMWLRTRAAGRYATAAAHGAGEESPGNILEFEAEHEAIDFFQPEGGASTFVWNSFRDAFDRYWTSD